MIAAIARHRWGGLGLVLVMAAAAAGWAAWRPVAAAVREHRYFAIGQLVINGCGPALTPDEVREWLGLTAESTLWEASPASVRFRLEEHPFIARAAVRRSFPGRLEITVRERRPRAIAVLDDLYYVDRAGVTFGPLRPRDSRDYPVITGIAPGLAAGARLWAIRRALRLLRRCDRSPCIGSLSEINVGDGRGVVVYPVQPHLPVVLGWGSWPEKLARAQRVLQAWQGEAERVASLDVRFRNQVVIALRPQEQSPSSSPRRRDNVRERGRQVRHGARKKPALPRAGAESKPPAAPAEPPRLQPPAGPRVEA